MTRLLTIALAAVALSYASFVRVAVTQHDLDEVGAVPHLLGEPLARANQLAEKMARVLNNEEVSDAAIALALLTGGVVDR